MTEDEKNVPAKEASEKDGARLQKENVHQQRKKGTCQKACKGQKETLPLSCGLRKKICKRQKEPGVPVSLQKRQKRSQQWVRLLFPSQQETGEPLGDRYLEENRQRS